MNEAWQTAKLGDICDIQIGGTPARKISRFWDNERQSKNVWLSIADMPNDAFSWVSDSKEYLSDEGTDKVKLVKRGTLLFSFKLSIGRVCFAGRDLRTNEAIAALSIKEGMRVEKEYLAWFLWGQDWNEITANDEKLKGKTLNKSKLKDVPVSIPSSAEQKRIVAILDEAFAGIDAAIANTEKNRANAQELFDGYLNRYLSDIANGEQVHKLSDLSELIVDCEHKTAPSSDSGFPSIRTTNVKRGYLDLENVNRVSSDTYTKWTRRARPEPGDLILSREAPAGNIGVIPEGQWVCLGQRTVLIRPDKDTLDPYYLVYLMLHPRLQERLLSNSTGATVQHVNMRDIRALGLGRLPDLDQQKIDVEKLDEIQNQIAELKQAYAQKLDSLSVLRQSLLRKAFSGEITAGKTETEAKEAIA